MSPIAMPFAAGSLLVFLAKATVLLLAALVATFTLQRATAGARHLVWLAALVGVLALPVLARIPMLRIGLLPASLSLASAAPTEDMIYTFAETPAVPPTPPTPPIPPTPPTPVLPPELLEAIARLQAIAPPAMEQPTAMPSV